MAKKQTPTRRPRRHPPMILGWREWVALPDLGIPAVKAKLDSGARSSSLHVSSIETYSKGSVEWVRFETIPDRKGRGKPVQATAKVADERLIRNSSGGQDLRVVIETTVEIAGWRWPIELSLASRSDMVFRMLLGRNGMSGRIVLDPSHSYLAPKPIPGRRL